MDCARQPTAFIEPDIASGKCEGGCGGGGGGVCSLLCVVMLVIIFVFVLIAIIGSFLASSGKRPLGSTSSEQVPVVGQ